MPTDPLVESDEFTANIVPPEAGLPRTAASVIQGLQAVTNRTRWLFNRSALAARYTINGGESYGSSSPMKLTQDFASSGIELTSGTTIQMPRAGVFFGMIDTLIAFNDSNADPSSGRVDFKMGDVQQFTARGNRFSENFGDIVPMVGGGLFKVATPASHTLQAIAVPDAAHVMYTGGFTGRLSLFQVG